MDKSTWTRRNIEIQNNYTIKTRNKRRVRYHNTKEKITQYKMLQSISLSAKQHTITLYCCGILQGFLSRRTTALQFNRFIQAAQIRRVIYKWYKRLKCSAQCTGENAVLFTGCRSGRGSGMAAPFVSLTKYSWVVATTS
jgi:hypothetical protein